MKYYNKTCRLVLGYLTCIVLAGCAGGLQQQPKAELLPTAVLVNVTADSTNVSAQASDGVTNMELVLVKGGCFQMGDTFGDGNADERPTHEACVSDFLLGKYEVTQSQWQKVMGDNPSEFVKCGPDCPVDSISWDMVQEFIKKKNALSGKQYRLPTEAEWEYAARSGGKKEKWAGTSDEATLGEFAWYDLNSNNSTHKVGLKKPNGLGLYDMTGNIREWCQDWYNERFYDKSPKDNPSELQSMKLPEFGDVPGRIMRGGVWSDTASLGRTTARAKNPVENSGPTHGFRLLLPAK